MTAATGRMLVVVTLMSELDQYDYDLPKELIAQQPLAHRSDARLMVVDRVKQSITHGHVRDLPQRLDENDCLVLNNTRVVPARLVGHREATGGRWEGLFLETDEQGYWRLIGKTRGRLTPDECIVLHDRQSREAFRLRLLSKLPDGGWLVRPEAPGSWLELLDRVGRVPLPHYIRGGEMRESDVGAYQTVFAERPGAVAAPTAGLHFTDDLLTQVRQRGVEICRVTLHVGLGTFRPIAVERLEEHQMHEEWGELGADTAERLRNCRSRGGRIVAVGTTAVRVLETASRDGELKPWQGLTDLFIRPPHTFHAVDALMTNFHLPRSTLLVLVRTFGGDSLLRQAYEEAVAEHYRFFSYGDAMLII